MQTLPNLLNLDGLVKEIHQLGREESCGGRVWRRAGWVDKCHGECILKGFNGNTTLILFKLISGGIVSRSPKAWTIISVFDLVSLKIPPKSGYFPAPVISTISIRQCSRKDAIIFMIF